MLPTTDHLIAAEESSAAAWMKGDATITQFRQAAFDPHEQYAKPYAEKAKF